MKRMNMLHFSKQKKTIDLIKEMESVEVEQHRVKLKKLLMERKNKLKELLGHKEIQQPDFNYLRKNHGDFSFIESNASKEPFITQKIKKRNQTSERAYSSSPNMKGGNPTKNCQNQQELQDKIILNRKFMEYDRVIDQQSGLRKMQALQKINQGKIYAYSRKKNNNMKRTFFQKMVIDKYNFYNANQYSSIRSGTLASSKTDTEMKSQAQILWKLKSAKTLESSIRDRNNSILSNSSLNKSRLSKNKIVELDRRIGAKSRIKSQGSQILPVSFKKYLHAIDN